MEDQRERPGLCSRRPSLDDRDLIAAIDGEADEEILAHIRDCPSCAERARDFDELQRLLRQHLYRILCPSSDDLAAYQQGWLDEQRQEHIRTHLRDCPHCPGELRLLAEAAQEATWAPTSPTPVPPSPPSSRFLAPGIGIPLINRLRRVVAVALAPRPQLTPAYGGLRGAAGGGQYAYRAENLELMLDVQRAAGRPGRVVLIGMLCNEDGNSAEVSRATASLLHNDVVISSALLDELGNFVLEDITPGHYSLSLRLPDLEVVVEALTL